jgi:hypothetical protein
VGELHDSIETCEVLLGGEPDREAERSGQQRPERKRSAAGLDVIVDLEVGGDVPLATGGSVAESAAVVLAQQMKHLMHEGSCCSFRTPRVQRIRVDVKAPALVDSDGSEPRCQLRLQLQ